MFAGSRQRLRMARDRRHSGAVRIFALLEVICFYFSFAALAFLGADLFLYYTVGFKLSGFWHAVLSISLTAAVGFLTNWIAIEMLFRPYRPIPWLFVWPQGLVPRNQAKIGEKAGEAVSSELLNPEKVTDRLCACVSDSLDDEQVRKEAAAQIIEYIRDAISAQLEKIPAVPGEGFIDKLAVPVRRLYDGLFSSAIGVTDRVFDSPKMTEWLNTRFIPSIKPSIESFVRARVPDALEKINFKELIAEEIEKFDPREFHELVNSVAAENLGAIQVLGFILGGLIGALMLLVP